MTENNDNNASLTLQRENISEAPSTSNPLPVSSQTITVTATEPSLNFNNLLELATGGGSNSSNLSLIGDDEVPTGTPREERLARKLKVIDVLSPKSNSDQEDASGNLENSSEIRFPAEDLLFSGPLHSPIPVATMRTRTMPQQEMFADPPVVNQKSNSSAQIINNGGGTIPRPTQPGEYSFHKEVPNPKNNTSNYNNNINSSRSSGGHHRLPSRVNLLVGGTRFVVNPNLFIRHPNTMLGRLFSSPNEYWRNSEFGEHEIAQDVAANVFKIILEYYKCGSMRCPPSVNVSELREACDYFLIPFHAGIVSCQNLSELLHELSNDGAKERFKSQFVENIILPKMIECAQRGNRECHLVILKDDDVVDWGEFPPNTGEEHADIVHCTSLYRFFKYFENRDVAKDALTERGLKKVKLGIEGYPTHMEKVKYKHHGKPEVIYNYIQRPFVHMSWEKEGSKSRHVDFQCVKPKHSVYGAVDEPAALAGNDLPPPGELLQGADPYVEPPENNDLRE